MKNNKLLPKLYVVFALFKDNNCRVTNCSPNPDGIGYGPNKPNTINL